MFFDLKGYLGRNGAETQTILVDNVEELYKLESDKDVEVTGVRILRGEKFLRVDYKSKKERATKNGSIVLALMTTAYARIKLYDVIAAYPKETIYFDTDSVFLLLPAGVEGPVTSSRLGGLKDEIKETYGPGHTIASFASLGPKTYTYTVLNEAGEVVYVELKAKGVCLSSEALKVVSKEALEDMAKGRNKEKAVLPAQFNFRRDILKNRLYAVNYFKRFRWSSTKRFFIAGPNEQGDTLPYGFGAEQDKEDQLDELITLLEMALDD